MGGVSGDGDDTGRVGWAVSLLRRTVIAIRGALGHREGRVVFAVVVPLYVLAYLAGMRQIGWRTDGSGVDVLVVANPLGTATRRVAPFQYESVALLTVGPVELLVAPVNVLIGVALASLVGVTLATSWVAWRGPTACRIGPGAGAAAGLPGLLSGVVCCGPTILLIIGVQASAGLLLAMQWLLPLAVVLLVGTLLWVGSKVEIIPEAPTRA